MVFDKFKNYHILRYIIYEFLKKVLGGAWTTRLVKILCAPSYSLVRRLQGLQCSAHCFNTHKEILQGFDVV